MERGVWPDGRHHRHAHSGEVAGSIGRPLDLSLWCFLRCLRRMRGRRRGKNRRGRGLKEIVGGAASSWNGCGLESGVDFEASFKRHKRLIKEACLEEVALLECFLAAGFWTEARKHEAGLLPTPVCPRCGANIACMQHILYECPVVNASENPDIQATNSLCDRASLEAAAWPCLWLRGLLPLGYAPVSPAARLVSISMFGVAPPSLDKWPGGKYFTDGSGGKVERI